MENQIQFGTINLSDQLNTSSSTYTAPTVLPKEMMEKISFAQDEVIQEEDQVLNNLYDYLKEV